MVPVPSLGGGVEPWLPWLINMLQTFVPGKQNNLFYIWVYRCMNSLIVYINDIDQSTVKASRKIFHHDI